MDHSVSEKCRVYLSSSRAKLRDEVAALLWEAGYEVLERNPAIRAAGEYEVAIVLLDHDHPDPTAVSAFPHDQGDQSPPVVVFGPPRGRKWRREAMEAGAFACLSGNALREDQLGMVGAASRYRAARIELLLIRNETEIVMRGLLESFGSEAQKLQSVVKEAEHVRESLAEVQRRIIRSML